MDSFEHALPSGTLIGERYRIDSVLGEGGFAITYKAFDTKLQCDVAIKEFLPNDLAARSSDTKTVQPRTNRNDDYSFGLTKFLDEARTLAQLQHPHIVQVTNFIEAHGTGYLVMTYAEGNELGDWLKTQPGKLSEEAILGIITPILEGITKVHQKCLLHRDIKPANIFLRNEGGPMLIDFGAARQSIGEKSKSISAIISQGYAPPEQYLTRGKQTPSTDLYAIGATVYHLITGKAPVESVERSHDVHEGDPDPMLPATDAGKGKVSDWLLQLTDQLLAISQKQRPQSAEAVLEAIKNKTRATIDALTTNAQNTDNKTRVIKEDERFASADAVKSSSAKNKTGLYAGIAAAAFVVIGAGVLFTQQSTSNGSENSKGESSTSQKSNKPLSQGKAILFVESTPSGAEVYLDNNLLGKTPYQADNLPQGIFELTLKHDTSSDLTESLQLTDNLLIKKSLRLNPATGNYSVFSTPAGAAVSIDGKDADQKTPASLTDITVGEHTLKLSKDSYYPKQQSIYIRKNENLRGDFTLEGGDLVMHEEKWIKPEEKTLLVSKAKAKEKAKEEAETRKRAKARADEENRKAELARLPKTAWTLTKPAKVPKPRPQDYPMVPSVFYQHTAFADAPVPAVKSYKITTKGKFNIKSEIRVEDFDSHAIYIHMKQMINKVSYKTKFINVLGGLVRADMKISTNNGPYESFSEKIIDVSNVEGKLFPLKVGNRLSFTIKKTDRNKCSSVEQHTYAVTEHLNGVAVDSRLESELYKIKRKSELNKTYYSPLKGRRCIKINLINIEEEIMYSPVLGILMASSDPTQSGTNKITDMKL